MSTMRGHPLGWAPLHCHSSHPGKQPPQPYLAHVATMRQQAMIAERDTETCYEIEENSENQINHSRREPEPEQSNGVDSKQHRTVQQIQTGSPTSEASLLLV